MRVMHWLFLVSAALFVVGIAFLVASTRPTGERPAVETVVTTPVASVQQIMRGIVAPAASVVFNSVATTITPSGTEERAPEPTRNGTRSAIAPPPWSSPATC